MKSCYFEGEMVAAPLYLVLGTMYYREDLLKALKNGDEIIKEIQNGVTWDEFITLSEKLKTKNPFYIFPGADYEGLVCVFTDQLLNLKPNYFEQNGFNFETPEAEKALGMLCALINQYKMSPPIITQFTEVSSYEYFIKNNGLFLWGWTSYDQDYKNIPYDVQRQNNLRKAPTPHFSNSMPASILGGYDLIVSKFSENKNEAVEFIKFLLSKNSQYILYQKSSYNPVLKKFYKDTNAFETGSKVSRNELYLMDGIYRPANEEYTRFSKIMSYYFNSALKQTMTVHEALSKCTKAIQSDKIVL
jgi:ABC-type glycerol-3-phosphate transport system substrate-binding protein